MAASLATASYVAPFQRLPTEILYKLITICTYNGVDITTIASVCSRLRHAALGMTTMWSKLSVRSKVVSGGYAETFWRCRRCYGSEDGGVKCATLEQLELVLARANSLPLNLRLQWPSEPGTLELLAARKRPIRHLSVSNRQRKPMTVDFFSELNLSALQGLRLENLNEEEEQLILDGALQSQSSDIILDVHNTDDIVGLLGHKMAQRAMEMRLWIEDDLDFSDSEFSAVKDITFPYVKTWRINGHPGLLEALDLSGA